MLLNFRMRVVAMRLNYSIKNIRNDVQCTKHIHIQRKSAVQLTSVGLPHAHPNYQNLNLVKMFCWLHESTHTWTPYITNQQYVFGHNHFVHQLLKKTAMWTSCNLKDLYAIVVQENNPKMLSDVIINLVSRLCLLLHCLNFYQRNTF